MNGHSGVERRNMAWFDRPLVEVSRNRASHPCGEYFERARTAAIEHFRYTPASGEIGIA
jgi:hypothetical protein